MDIERLKEARRLLGKMNPLDGSDWADALDIAERAIDEAIAKQSATSEEVQFEINRLKEVLKQTKEAADELKDKKYAVNMKPVYDQIKSLELQITALQAYQPTTRKNRMVEEVAISKMETTSARALSCWYCTEIEKHGVVAVKTVLDKAGRELDAYNTPYNYCPNCGRKLKENER